MKKPALQYLYCCLHVYGVVMYQLVLFWQLILQYAHVRCVFVNTNTQCTELIVYGTQYSELRINCLRISTCDDVQWVFYKH